MKILIIGGSGFLGLALAKELIKKKHLITIYDLEKPDIRSKLINFTKGNILNTNLIGKIIKKNQVIYHLAGISDIGEAIQKPTQTVKQNILATVNILNICLKFKIKRFIFASTIYVHSSQGGFYRISKNCCEQFIEEFGRKKKLKYTILRYGTIYGPSKNLKNNINRITSQALKKNIVRYDGSVLTKRKIIYISDAAHASCEILKKKYENKVVMITGKKYEKIKNIMSIIKKKLNIKSPLVFKNKKIEGHYILHPFTYKKPKEIKLIPKKPVKPKDGIDQIIYFLKKNYEKI
jgi:UDP-glucose 4-epimerase